MLKVIFSSLYFSIVMLFFSMQSKAAEDFSEEQKIKVALIYKLGKFIQWPEDTMRSGKEVFMICVLGEDLLNPAFVVLKSRKINGLPIDIKYVAQSTDIDDVCQVVFIAESKQAFLKNILQRMSQHPILTISDSHGFAESGGIIELHQEENSIGFIINLDSARKTGLKISAPLLELSTVIGKEEEH